MWLSLVRQRLSSAVPAIAQWHTGWVWAAMFALTLAAAFGDHFELAYAGIVVLALYSIGAWLNSDTLARKRPEKILLYIPGGRHLLEWAPYKRWAIVPPLGILIVAGIAVEFVYRVQSRHELQQLEGKLYPAFDPTPSLCGQTPKGSMLLVFGDNGSIVTSFPHTIVAFGGPPPFKLTPILVVDGDGESIWIDFTIRSEDNRVIVKMDRDGFLVNRNNYLDMHRPDRHTIRVTDQQGRIAIYARFANPSTLILDGYMNLPGIGLVPLQLEGISHGCAINGGADSVDFLLH